MGSNTIGSVLTAVNTKWPVAVNTQEEEERETKQIAGKGKIVCGAEQVG
jgi:hypothetical protein